MHSSQLRVLLAHLSILSTCDIKPIQKKKKKRARADLKNLKMKMPEIDKYISEFEDLICRAGYQTSNTEVMELFMAGLPTSILKDVMQKIPHNYKELKLCAVNCTHSSVLIYNILQGRKDGQSFRGFQQNQRNNQ